MQFGALIVLVELLKGRLPIPFLKRIMGFDV